MNQTLRGVLMTAVMMTLLAALLLFGASAIAYMTVDPNALLYPFSLALLVMISFGAGVLSVRLINGNPLVGGLIGAGIFLLLMALTSLFFRDGESVEFPRLLLTVVTAISGSLVGAFIAKPRAVDPTKRRKKLERRFMR